MKKINKAKSVSFILAIALMFTFSIQLASAFEVVPAYKEVTFTPNGEETVELLIRNSEDRTLNLFAYVEGPLNEYIEIQESIISIPANSEKIVKYTIKMPETFAEQGLHESKFILRELPSSETDETITAKTVIISKIKLIVPYSGKYLESRLLIPDFKPGQQNSFAVEISSKGTEWVEDAKTTISIFGPMNERIATLYGDEISLNPGEKQMIFIPWTPDVGPGIYRAVSTVIYDDKNSVDDKKFTIGELTLAILGITVDKFKLGGIAEFNILVENQWNQPADNVFTKASVRDEDGKVYTTFKSSTENIPPYGQQQFKAYWDTDKVNVGTYYLGIGIEYANKVTTAVYEIFVDTNDINVMETGMAVTKDEESKVRVGTIITIALLIAVLLIAVQILRALKQGGNRYE